MEISEAYDQWAESYDTDRNLTRDLDHLVLKEELQGMSPGAVLELGCGTGKNTAFLGRISRRVVALDFSTEMIARAREKVSAPNVSFTLSDLTRPWRLEDSEFDLVVANLVLEHIEHLPHVFSESGRALRPGGGLFISELHPARQYLGKQATFEREEGAVRIPAFLHHLSDFLEAAEQAGFALVRLREWWCEEDQGKPPRLLSLLFRRAESEGGGSR